MKTLPVILGSLLLLNSCVFEAPFETEAKLPVDQGMIGRWEGVSSDAKQKPEDMLVLQYSANEYVVEYPVGEKAMFFRAFLVEMADEKYIQTQLIGTAEGPVKPADRKYHLHHVTVDGDAMEMRTINPKALGKEPGTPALMKAAFIAHKDDPELFGESLQFRKSGNR